MTSALARRPEWRLFVAETKTGRVVDSRVPFAGLPRAGSRLNTQGTFSATIPMTQDYAADLIGEFLEPWKWSWGLAWGSHIVQYGPLIAPEYDPEGEAWQITAAGIWKLFTDKRALISPAWNGAGMTDPSGDTGYVDTLRNIAIRLVQDNLARTAAGLPIDIPAKDPQGTNERNYQISKLKTVGTALDNLTDDVNGPEIEFRPYFPDEIAMNTVRYELRVGSPNLGNLGFPHLFISGRGGALVTATPGINGERTADNYYVPGNGTDQLTPIGNSRSTTLTANGFPLLDDIDTSHTSTTEQSTLDGYAAQNRSRYQAGARVLQAVVRIDGRDASGAETGSPSMDQVRNGDTCILKILGYIGTRPGVYRCRVLGKQPAVDTVALELQVLSVV